ncbi:MAG: DUF58 domain-containing protein [Clostridia bacterium]|nr:DUF58 domain-containing protein [Clostridia bacterium]
MIRCPHRGVYQAGIARVSVTDIFGLVRLSRRPGLKMIGLEVAPRPTYAPPLKPGSADQGARLLRRAAEDNASPADVRAWQEGDELKKVHWKLSLRKGEVMVRTFEESARPDTLVIPDLQPADAFPEQRLDMEDCVCEAALGAAVAQLRAGYPVRMPLICAHPRETAGQFPADAAAFSDALLRVPFDSPYSYEQVLRLMMGRLQRTGGAVLITPELTTRIADIALSMQRLGVSIRLIWISDDDREASMALLERMKMGGVQAARLDPWEKAARPDHLSPGDVDPTT